MIDLRDRELPNQIEIGGSFFHIKTDFRIWIEFGDMIRKEETLMQMDISKIFEDEIPSEEYIVEIFEKLQEFFINKNPTPNSSGGGSDERLFDYILDGEYIVGSFMQAYGIDLTSVNYMHWHLFKALFVSLPDNTKMSQIMSMRGYRKSKDDYDTSANKSKQAWKLPSITELEKKEILDEIDEIFYNS